MKEFYSGVLFDTVAYCNRTVGARRSCAVAIRQHYALRTDFIVELMGASDWHVAAFGRCKGQCS